MNLLDMRTVIISYGISNLICMVVMVALWRQTHRKFAGLGFWVADFGMQFIAIVLVILRGRVPDLLSMTGSNAVSVGGTILIFVGLEHFTGKRGPQLHNYILLAVFILAHIYFVLFLPSLSVRNILFSSALLAICSQCAWLMLRRVDPENRLVTSSIGHVFIVFCLISIARLVVDLVIPSGNDFFHSNLYDTLVLITYQMLFILLTLALAMMVNHRLSTDLESDIMARKQAEGALRLREREFKTLVENSPDAVTRFDRDGRYQYVNPARAWYFGRSVGEIQGKTVWDLLGPDEMEEGKIADASLKQIFENPKEFTVEYQTKTPEGLRWVQSRGVPEFAEDGSMESVLVVTRDITERMQMEESLAQLASFPELNPQPVIELDLDGNITYLNLAAKRVFPDLKVGGKDHSSLSGLAIIFEEFLKGTILTTTRDIQSGESIYEQAINYVPEYKRVRIYCRDITERKQMESALRQSEEEHRIIVQTALDGFWQIDTQGCFVQVNDAYCRMSGYSEQELLSMKISDLEAVELPEITAAHLQKVMAQGQDRFETRHRRKNGTVFDIAISVQYRDERLFAFLRDIDELMQYALDEIGKVIGSPIGFYHFVEEDQNTLSLQAWSTRTMAEFCKAEGKGMHYPISEAGVWVDCVRERKPIIHNDYASLPNRKGMPAGHAEVTRELVVPTMRNGRIVAILGVGNKPVDYDQKDVEFVSYIADVVWTIVEQKQANERILQLNTKLEQLAMTDELTGLFNRRSFFNRGVEEIRRSQRYHSPLSLLMLDIDGFKAVNDTFGHDVGDHMLRCVADTLLHNIREIDVLARLGGEEFGILLPNTEAADAVKLAERLRLAIEKTSCAVQDQKTSVTVSIGVATRKKEIQSIDGLLKRADTAMYQAKNQGRNRVIVYDKLV
jgi:diguanylate cyclase (GGDEF)-like protein/PAS domain S-box-containing protein